LFLPTCKPSFEDENEDDLPNESHKAISTHVWDLTRSRKINAANGMIVVNQHAHAPIIHLRERNG
jgi:hypothetical protein